jgi:mannonate dehydratase
MKLGLGLGEPGPRWYGGQDNHKAGDGTATARNLTFCRQLGITHIIYSGGPTGFRSDEGSEFAPDEGYWRYEDLCAVRERIESHGLVVEAIENFPPRYWDKILLGDKVGRVAQMANLKKTITNMGRAGIPTMGYCFSLTGTWGRNPTRARGGAKTQGWNIDDVRDDAHPAWPGEEARVDVESPLPNGYVWKSWIQGSWEDPPGGSIGTVSEEEMWERVTFFLRELVPVAEAAGVTHGPPCMIHHSTKCMHCASYRVGCVHTHTSPCTVRYVTYMMYTRR